MQATTLRSHNCGQLRIEDDKSEVKLCGWVQSRRDHGGIIFVDLRDRNGITQIVFAPEQPDSFKLAEGLRREDCLQITGNVRPRGEGLENPRLSTGKIEVVVSQLNILSKSKTPPFEIDDEKDINDDLRLEYRYLDLRRPKMQQKMEMRSKLAQSARKYLCEEEGFLEIETPYLIKSTPEGARDYVVPSRVNKHKFYALPQSPQIYKQLLMVGGCDRYVQFAKCFRDEDLRTDRQPEFTQIDLEMSFVGQEDVLRVVEGIVASMCEAAGVPCQTPFPRLSYAEAMDKYSVDRPDVRFELFTTDVTDIVKDSEFSVFNTVIQNGGIVKCINPESDMGRKDIDRYIKLAQDFGAKGMAWMRVQNGTCESNIAKYFSDDVKKKLVETLGAKDGSLLMFIADEKPVCNDVISRLRLAVGKDLGLIDESKFAFRWVLDFPLFEKTDDGWTPMHHMFTMPKEEFWSTIASNPGAVLSDAYDLVLNGFEIAGGSIRCHRQDIQEQIMSTIGFPKEDAEERFGFLLKALEYGAPPHGGIAFGFDRVCSLFSGTSDIREVMAFPKNKQAQCPMDGAPASIAEKQLKELHIKLDKKE